MICKGCGREAHDWFGDAWCDECGGVMARPGLLIFRHVATVDGQGGRLPVVWDESGQYYKFRYPFSGMAVGRGIDSEFRRFGRQTFRSAMGSLDAVLTMALPRAKGEGDGVEVSFAPTSTEAERSILVQ